MPNSGSTPADAWLDRYKTGERQAVWKEMRELGASIRLPGVIEPASQVVEEATSRAKHNVDLLVERLRQARLRPHAMKFGQPSHTLYNLPSLEASEFVEWLDQRIGPIPLIIASWIRNVGDIWALGSFPGWPDSHEADPMVVEFEFLDSTANPKLDMEDEIAEWELQKKEANWEGPFEIPFASDQESKAGRRGGAPRGIPLPDAGADAIVTLGLQGSMSFVDYLNDSFSHGGFPGVSKDDSVGQAVIAELREGMLEI